MFIEGEVLTLEEREDYGSLEVKELVEEYGRLVIGDRYKVRRVSADGSQVNIRYYYTDENDDGDECEYDDTVWVRIHCFKEYMPKKKKIERNLPGWF